MLDMGKNESYFNTVKHKEWGDINDELKQIVFHRYFLGKSKGGKYDVKWDDENKYTLRLRKFISSRVFNEYGDIVGKGCNYCGATFNIDIFLKDERSRDGKGGRCKGCRTKRRRR